MSFPVSDGRQTHVGLMYVPTSGTVSQHWANIAWAPSIFLVHISARIHIAPFILDPVNTSRWTNVVLLLGHQTVKQHWFVKCYPGWGGGGD